MLLSEYELIRQENIRRNDAFLATLGLDSVKPDKEKTKSQSKEKRPQTVLLLPTRRSLRVAEIQPAYYEPLDDDDDDDVGVSKKKRQKLSSSSSSSVSLKPKQPPSEDSCRAIDAQMQQFQGDWLGKLCFIKKN